VFAVEKASFTEDGRIALRRKSHFVNGYNPWMLSALRCNHDIKHMWGNYIDQLAALFYITNYMTKQNKKLLNMFPVIEAAVTQ
jgi:hypothetical protein